MSYTNEEYWEMVRAYARANDSVTGAIKLYCEAFPNRRAPTRYVMLKVNQCLREFGQFTVPVHAQGRGAKPHSVDLQEHILEYFVNEPEASTRQAARYFGVSQWTVWNILHEDGLHAFRHHPAEELKASDNQVRVNFCQWYLKNTDKNVLFTDEAIFTKLGLFNVRNKHWWANSNPNVKIEDGIQQTFSVNVWAGILGNCLLGPYFIEGEVNSDRYVAILNNFVKEMLDDVPLSYHHNLFYQHDGAPAHSQQQVRDYLSEHFPDKWIGREGPVHWPAYSSDLNPLNYYLWGEVKRLVYATEFSNIDELKSRIVTAFEEVRSESYVLDRVKENLQKRAELCIMQGGQHIEHLLKYM